MTTIIAIANQKGGVGKTTTTISLGAGLHRLGQRVLLIDLDPQAALSASVGIRVPELSTSMYEVLVSQDVTIKSIIRTTPSGPDVAPSNIDLSAAEVELISEMGRERILKDILSTVVPDYDFILIDCPPSLGLLTINALVAANKVLIPLQCEYLAMRGMQLLLRTIEKVRAKLNPKLEIAGILPTMYDGRTVHSREVLEEVRSSFGSKVYDIIIKETVRLKEAPATALSILDYAAGHEVATAYMALAKEIMT